MKRKIEIALVSFIITSTIITGISTALIVDLSSQLGRTESTTPIAGMVVKSASHITQAHPLERLTAAHPKSQPYLQAAYYLLPRGLRIGNTVIKALNSLL